MSLVVNLDDAKRVRNEGKEYFEKLASGSMGSCYIPMGERGCRLRAALDWLITEHERLELEIKRYRKKKVKE